MLRSGEGPRVLRKADFKTYWLQRDLKLPGSLLPGRIQFSTHRPLVSLTGAFYNRRNSQPAAVVSFSRGPDARQPNIDGSAFPCGYLKIDLYSGISQEH